MTPERRRLLLVAAGALLVALLVVGFFSGMSEQHRLDRARRATAAKEASLRSTRTLTTKERAALQKAYDINLTLTQDLVAANADVAFTQNDLATATRELSDARAVFSSATNRRATVESCLNGVKLALDATGRHQTSAATLYLHAAAPACLSALTPSNTSAPVLAFDFADPFVMRVGGTYYAFATNAAGGSVQTAVSHDFTHWNLTGNALGNIPSWGAPGSVWAPATLVRFPGTVLYYTVREKSTGHQCISVAVGSAPGGPFLDGSSKPLECGDNGAIDPSPFVDANGAAYLLFKTERPARIWSRPLAPDGRSFSGPARLLLTPSKGWEAGNVEAPSMLRNGSAYWLFYSGNDWNGGSYAEGVARCYGPTGPCGATGAPVLSSHGDVRGPGGGEVFTDASGGWWLVYHAYQEPLVGYPNSRLPYFGRIGFSNGTPTVSP